MGSMENDKIQFIHERTLIKDTAQQGALAGATLACSGVKGSAIIVHGSPGCGWAARWMRSDHAVTNYVPIIATSLLEHEFIFGGAEKLRDTIRWVIKNWKPRQLFLINGDTGSLINDPIEDIAREFEAAHKIPIIALDSAFFKGLEATGVDEAFYNLLRRFSRHDLKVEKDAINIIAPFCLGSNNWVYDLEEIKRLLDELGLHINCVLTHDTKIEDIQRFFKAEADLWLTYEELPKFKLLEEERHMKRIGLNLPLPIGVANTEDWYLAVAEEMGKTSKAKEVLLKERQWLRSLKFSYNSTWLQSWLADKYAAVSGPANWASSFANFLYFDLSVYPSVIALYSESQEAIDRAKECLREMTACYQPIILENPLYIQLAEAVENSWVQFSVGQSQEKSLFEGMNISHLSLAGSFTIFGAYNFIPYPSMGMKGVLYLLTMMGRILEETYHEPERWIEQRYKGGKLS